MAYLYNSIHYDVVSVIVVFELLKTCLQLNFVNKKETEQQY